MYYVLESITNKLTNYENRWSSLFLNNCLPDAVEPNLTSLRITNVYVVFCFYCVIILNLTVT